MLPRPTSFVTSRLLLFVVRVVAIVLLLHAIKESNALSACAGGVLAVLAGLAHAHLGRTKRKRAPKDSNQSQSLAERYSDRKTHNSQVPRSLFDSTNFWPGCIFAPTPESKKKLPAVQTWGKPSD